MGWHDVYVLDDLSPASPWKAGPRKSPRSSSRSGRPSPRMPAARCSIFSTSLRFHHAHIPGAWWAVRSRLDEAQREDRRGARWSLTSEDGVLRTSRRPRSQALWPQAQVRVLDGGNAAWIGPLGSGQSAPPPCATTSGTSPTTTRPDLRAARARLSRLGSRAPRADQARPDHPLLLKGRPVNPILLGLVVSPNRRHL